MCQSTEKMDKVQMCQVCCTVDRNEKQRAGLVLHDGECFLTQMVGTGMVDTWDLLVNRGWMNTYRAIHGNVI